MGMLCYVGLWQGPAWQQLESLENSVMPVIYGQNHEELDPRWRDEIVGWLQDDEPDNAPGTSWREWLRTANRAGGDCP